MSYPCHHCDKKLANTEALYEHLRVWHKHLPRKQRKHLDKNYKKRK
jgi:hypothetical protein